LPSLGTGVYIDDMAEKILLDDTWKRCFELAWEAHLEGSNPIASVVTNEAGNIVGSGKSAVRGEVTDVVISRREIAHAEVNALLQLDNRVHGQVNDYTLYATLEPCPVCFGAFYMSGIRQLKFAAKDGFGGSTNLMGSTPYLSRKPIKLDGPVDGLAELSIFMNVYCDVVAGRESEEIHAEFACDYPSVVEAAQLIGKGDRLGIRHERDFDIVLDRIADAIGQSTGR
jgi:tRNA(adenine34) deaminase